MACTKRNPEPPCGEGYIEKATKKGELCCYKDTKKTSPKTKKESPKTKKCTSRNPEPPCKEGYMEKETKNGDLCCYKGIKKESPKTKKGSEKKSDKMSPKIRNSLIDNERYNTRKGIYDDIKECEKEQEMGYMVTNFKYTNPRVKFDHLYFHAGDWSDIEKYGLLHLRIEELGKNNLKMLNLDHDIYNNYNYESIYNTFNYLFYYMKKGIYVSIRNNKLKFLPFSNANYRNPNFARLYLDDEDKKLLNELKREVQERRGKNKEKIKSLYERLNKKLNEFEKKTSQKREFEKDRQRWISNNCNIRNFGQGNVEGDINHNIYRDLLEETCKHIKVNDCDFFMNVRDFPLLHKKYLEPYDELFDDVHERAYIPRIYQTNMCPILSNSKNENYADLMMVNADDWSRVSNKYYMNWKDGCNKKTEIFMKMKLKDKINKVIFRGSATGCGQKIETNMRLKAAELGEKYPEIFDIGITDWNARPKKSKNNPVNIIDSTKFSFSVKSKIVDEEKFRYKYILHIDGHVSAYRLGGELNSGSVILKVESKNIQWISYLLEPYKHYVPIKEDLSDLLEKYEWCETNEKECEKIIINAKLVYKKYLSKEGILSYTGSLINNLSSLRSKDDFLRKEISEKSIAIISIFRDDKNNSRENQRLNFIEIMNGLFKGYNYKIYIIEQSDDRNKFNIGKLKNIGFEIANKEKKYDHYIFTDIDMIPDTKLMKYYLMTPPDSSPISLAIDGTRYHTRQDFYRNREKNYKPFFGGVCSFTEEQFIKVNGYPNNIYGWGGEDDELEYRINLNGLSIGYPKDGSVLDIEEVDNKQILDKKIKVQNILGSDEKEKMRWEKINNYDKLWNENGVNNLFYTDGTVTNINKNTKQIIVNLDKEVDEELFEEWFPKEKLSDEEVKKYKEKIKSINWRINII